jgi:hypothetical protein
LDKDQYNKIQTTNSFIFSRKNDSTGVEVQGYGDKGVLNIVTDGSDKGEGQINVRILNNNNSGILQIFI